MKRIRKGKEEKGRRGEKEKKGEDKEEEEKQRRKSKEGKKEEKREKGRRKNAKRNGESQRQVQDDKSRGVKTRNVCRTKNGEVSNKIIICNYLTFSYYPKRESAMFVRAGLSAQQSAVFMR